MKKMKHGLTWVLILIFLLAMCLPAGAEDVRIFRNPAEAAAAYSRAGVSVIDVSDYTAAAVREDGTLLVSEEYDQQVRLTDYNDIVAVRVLEDFVVALRADGSRIIYPEDPVTEQLFGVLPEFTDIALADSHEGECLLLLTPEGSVKQFGLSEDHSLAEIEGEMYDWSDIQAISVYDDRVLGLREDGTVVIASLGYSPDEALMAELDKWTDIVRVSLSRNHVAGLRADGTVVAAGDNDYGQCDTDAWTDIISVATSDYLTLGLRADGTVVVTGDIADEIRDIVKRWRDIVAVDMNADGNIVALCADGTMLSADTANYYQAGSWLSGWADITAVSAGDERTLGLRSDGTVVAAGDNYSDACDVEDWSDIVVIAAGEEHSVGLRSDGTVVAAGDNSSDACDVEDWSDIAAIAAGGDFTLGLHTDGSVIAVGLNDYGQCEAAAAWTDIIQLGAGIGYSIGLHSDGTVSVAGNVEYGIDGANSWTDITAIAAGGFAALGLRSDGTVVSTNSDITGDVSGWTDIISITAGSAHSVGLRADGTVCAAGDNDDGQCDVADWTDIIAIAAAGDHTVGLHGDGTLESTGDNSDGQGNVMFSKIRMPEGVDVEAIVNTEFPNPAVEYASKHHNVRIDSSDYHAVMIQTDGTVRASGNNDYGQCDVTGMKHIISVAVGEDYTVCLRSDGKVKAVGNNEDGQCDVGDWRDIIEVSVGINHTVGLREDGTVVATGNNEDGQCDVGDWTDIVDIAAGDYHTVGLRKDGTVLTCGSNESGQCDTLEWEYIVSVAAGAYHTMGLTDDGTVVAVGSDVFNRLDVRGWENIVAIAAGGAFSVGLREDGTVAAAGTDLIAGNWSDRVRDWSDVVEISAGTDGIFGFRSDGTFLQKGYSFSEELDIADLTGEAEETREEDTEPGETEETREEDTEPGETEEAQEEVSEPEEPDIPSAWKFPVRAFMSTGYGNAAYGTELPTAYLGKVLYIQDEVGGWFRMTAPADGDYTFSVLTDVAFSIELNVGDRSQTLRYDADGYNIQKQTVTGVREGEVLSWWNNGGNWQTLQHTIRMAVDLTPRSLPDETAQPRADEGGELTAEDQADDGGDGLNFLTGDSYVESSHTPDWETPTSTYVSGGNGNPDYGTELPASCYGEIIRIEDEVGGWFRTTATKDCEYEFSVCTDVPFSIELTIAGEKRSFPFQADEDHVQSVTLTDIHEGDVLSWWNNGGDAKTLQHPFRMRITAESYSGNGNENDDSPRAAAVNNMGVNIIETIGGEEDPSGGESSGAIPGTDTAGAREYHADSYTATSEKVDGGMSADAGINMGVNIIGTIGGDGDSPVSESPGDIPATDAAQAPGDQTDAAAAEARLRALLQEQTGREPFLFFCADYDGNGTHEAFALLGQTDEWSGYSGDIWFVNANGATRVQQGLSYFKLEMLGNSPIMIFLAEEYYGGSGSVTHTWMVEGDQPKKVEAQVAGDMEWAGGNDYYGYPSAFDMFDDGTGHTWKRYYFYMDNGTLREYGGINISLDELLEFDGAAELIDAKRAEGYTVTGVIYRANGVINVNLKQGNMNANLSLRYDDTSVQYWEENSGIYLTASDPSIAVYPEGFRHPAGSGAS